MDSIVLETMRVKESGPLVLPLPSPASPQGSPDETTELLTITRLRQAARAQTRAAGVSIELDSPMQIDIEYPVTLIVQAQGGDGKTAGLDTLASKIPAPSALRETVNVAREVRAQIAAADFDVTEVKGDWQNVLSDTPTVWAWKLKPRSAGSKTVLFFLDQKIRTADEQYVVPVENYPRSIDVEIGFGAHVADLVSRFGAVGGFLVAAIGAAVGLMQLLEWGLKWRRRLRRGRPSPADPPAARL